MVPVMYMRHTATLHNATANTPITAAKDVCSKSGCRLVGSIMRIVIRPIAYNVINIMLIAIKPIAIFIIIILTSIII